MRNKITIVGAGNVGSTLAQCVAVKGYADVVLLDVVEGLPQGKALDIQQSGPITGSDACITGTNNWEATAGSHLVVIAAGMARRPGMVREDMLLPNMNIVKSVVEQTVTHSPDCVIIVVTNPLDAMTQLALHVSKFPRTRVLGQSGILDTARFRAFLAEELRVSANDVHACILGMHGDSMVPIPRLTTVAGIPITELLPRETIESITRRTIKAGDEIAGFLKTGTAYYAPAMATAQMIEAILFDEKKILPCATYLEGEYGIKGVVIGVPVKLGINGIEQIIELKLTPEESAALKKSADAVRELVTIMKLG